MRRLWHLGLWIGLGFAVNVAVAAIDWQRQEGVTRGHVWLTHFNNPQLLISWGPIKADCGLPFVSFTIADPDDDRYRRDASYRETCGRSPTAPVWRGVALNTLLYGGAGWLLIVGIPAARRWRRSKEGHCATCGYDLAGIDGVCPECGATT